MICPVCGEKMKEVEKCGIELDICPGCKGVWLDRGELEKLMEYAATTGAGAAAPQGPAAQGATPQAAAPAPPPVPEAGRGFSPAARPEYDEPYRHHDHDDDDDDDHHGHHRRGGHDDDHYRGYGEQHGGYPRKKSWIANIFDAFGD